MFDRGWGMHGDADRLVSVGAAKALHEAIPGSQLRTFEGMGHELPRALWPEIVDEIALNARRNA